MNQPDNGEKVGAVIIPVDPEMREIISVFVEEAIEYVEAISNAIAESDFQTIGRLGHTIKGDALAVGFANIAVFGILIEAAAKSENRDQIESLVAELANQMEQVAIGLE